VTAFALCGNGSTRQISVEKIENRLKELSGKLRYYTPQIHKAAFDLPPYIQELTSEVISD
jgi:spermidine synthase